MGPRPSEGAHHADPMDLLRRPTRGRSVAAPYGDRRWERRTWTSPRAGRGWAAEALVRSSPVRSGTARTGRSSRGSRAGTASTRSSRPGRPGGRPAPWAGGSVSCSRSGPSASRWGRSLPTPPRVGTNPDDLTFFIGSIFFTTASFLQYYEVASTPTSLGDPHRKGPRALFRVQHHRIDWWAAIIQLAGTLWFNRTTLSALVVGLGASTRPSPRVAPRRTGLHLLPRLELAGLGRGVRRGVCVATLPHPLVDHVLEPRRLGGVRRLGHRLLRRAERTAGQPGPDQPRHVRRRRSASWSGPFSCSRNGHSRALPRSPTPTAGSAPPPDAGHPATSACRSNVMTGANVSSSRTL